MSLPLTAQVFLEVEDLALSYGKSAFGLAGASFSARKGEVIALLGPSGCGKTTLLNLIAGFLVPDHGSIRVAGRSLRGVPPHRRDMAMVFQNYALFPHLSVEKNVAFGLEAHQVPRQEREPRIADALAMVGLSDSRTRYPRQLSGGQQQRVALARAMVVRPSILLLDEPLSNLDTLLRKSMREEIRQILDRTGITAVLVTHDQEEALVVADRILLMSNGKIEQIGTPEEIYERPRTEFGARFMAVENIMAGSVFSGDTAGTTVNTAIGQFKCTPCDVVTGANIKIAVRPERMHIVAATSGSQSYENRVTGRVVRSTYHGTYRRLLIAVHGMELIVHAPVSSDDSEYSGDVQLTWRPADTHVLLQ